jgi:O-antigen ligase
MAALKSKKIFLLTIILMAAVLLTQFDTLYATQMTGNEEQGNLLRLDIWTQSLNLTKEHLLLGTGIGGYALYYMTFMPTQGWATHSNYLDVFAQTGIIGILIFFWFLFTAVRLGFSLRKQWPSGFAAGYVNGALAGLIGVLVAMYLGDWLIPFVYTQTIEGFRYTVHSWVFLGILAAFPYLKQES